MKNKQIAYLFLASLTVLFVGMGLYPILPLYADKFGASQTTIGIFFAIMYVANAAGAAMAGPLGNRYPRKRVFLAVTAPGILSLLLLGKATALWQVIVLTSYLWFSGGMAMAFVYVFTGAQTHAGNRGKAFSLMALATPLGAILGGATVGQIIEHSGYLPMFLVLAGIWALLPFFGLLLKEKVVATKAPAAVNSAGASDDGASFTNYGRNLLILMVIVLLSSIAISAGRLGTSFSMQNLTFSPGQVASTAIIGGLITAPLTLLLGALSDKLGRERFVMLGYFLVALGALILSSATMLWHFWLASTMLMVALSINNGLASALAADYIPAVALGSALPRLRAIGSLSGIVSHTGAGLIMDTMGSTTLYLTVTGLAIAAALLVIELRLLKGTPVHLPVSPRRLANKLGNNRAVIAQVQSHKA